MCQWQEGWEDVDVDARAAFLSRQGVGMIQAERLRVVDEEATAEAFRGGWFPSRAGRGGHIVPDEEWGERPKAFVVLKPGEEASEKEINHHVESTIARYKVPKAAAFLDELPTTSTGKVPKFELREREWAGQDSRIKEDQPAA